MGGVSIVRVQNLHIVNLFLNALLGHQLVPLSDHRSQGDCVVLDVVVPAEFEPLLVELRETAILKFALLAELVIVVLLAHSDQLLSHNALSEHGLEGAGRVEIQIDLLNAIRDLLGEKGANEIGEEDGGSSGGLKGLIHY